MGGLSITFLEKLEKERSIKIKIKKISVISPDNSQKASYAVLLDVNHELLEKIFFKKVEVKEIFIGSTRKQFDGFVFLEANRSSGSYLVKIAVYDTWGSDV